MNDSQVEVIVDNAGETALMPRDNEMAELIHRMAEAFQVPAETLQRIQQIEIAAYPVPAYGFRITITPK